MTITGSAMHIHELLPAVCIFHARRLRAHDRENAEDDAEQIHQNQSDDINRDRISQNRNHANRGIKFFALMHRAIDAQRDRDPQRGDRREDIDEDRVLHRRADDVHDVLREKLGIAKITLQKSTPLAIDVWAKAHPSRIAHDQRRIQTHGFAQIVVKRCVLFRLQRLSLSFELCARRIRRNQIVQGVHQQGHNQEHDHDVSQTLENILAHLISSFLMRRMQRRTVFSNDASKWDGR